MDKRLMAISGILLVLFGVTYGKLFRQDYYFDQRAGGWLKFHPIPLGWIAAVLACHNEGAILASPLDEDMSKALTDIMVDNRLTTSRMFTGISNIYQSSVYQSVEGVPISDICISWSAEPDVVKLTSQKNCIAMNANATVTAVSCSESLLRLPFACYRKTGIELGICGPVENGYKFNTRTGSCYKAHNSFVTWSEGYKICAREGAHLAIINSDIEAEVLLELAKKVTFTSNLLFGGFGPSRADLKSMMIATDMSVNIGIAAWSQPPEFTEYTWTTIHGQSLKDAGYDKWAPKQPNNIHDQLCGSLYANSTVEKGLLNNSDCKKYKYNFICEIDLTNKSSPN